MRVSLSGLVGCVGALGLLSLLSHEATGSPNRAPGFTRTRLTAAENTRMRQHAHEEEALEHGLYFPLFTHGNRQLKEVALTFDDGPHANWTPQLLDLLRSLKVRATFFVVGKMVDKYPELVARELADGHEIANHTYDHLNLKKLPLAKVEKEIKDGAEAIRRAVGYTPMFFRPPGGQYNSDTLKAAADLHFTLVLWTANSKDFTYPAPAVLEQRLLAKPINGGILLCHDGIPATMQILPDLVAKLRAQGYSFVTVSELARHSK
jgi:peptidoglycan/xylan/chitin deacetylase (PgdA/CDA1 family)